MYKAKEKAAILVEALPYIKKFHGKTVVIKYGGNAMINKELKDAVMQDIVLMKYVGMNPVVIHGGGPEINTMLKRVNKVSKFINGLRVTDEEVMEIVEMVLVGKVNKEIVSGIQQNGGRAMGLSGKDGGLITAKKKKYYEKDMDGNQSEIDLGFVGEVESIKASVIREIIAQGYVPVIAPIGISKENETYNINADYVAGKVAEALSADKFVLLTDTEGIYDDRGDEKKFYSSLNVNEVDSLIEEGVINGGMIPKVECCVEAIENGVGRVHIIDGRIPHSILLEIFTTSGIGTMIVK
ncbi:acetylglutamate kinase [Clostridia bacterium]|nr:acetylglutamate kinase [Clostridia bacterium]